MNIIVIQIIMSIWVRPKSKSAAPFEKVAATRGPPIIMMAAMNFWTLFPKYFETIYGIVNPSL